MSVRGNSVEFLANETWEDFFQGIHSNLADLSFKTTTYLESLNENLPEMLRDMFLFAEETNNLALQNVEESTVSSGLEALEKISEIFRLNTTVQDSTGDTLVHYAARSRRESRALNFLSKQDKYAETLEIRNLSNETPFEIAINSANAVAFRHFQPDLWDNVLYWACQDDVRLPLARNILGHVLSTADIIETTRLTSIALTTLVNNFNWDLFQKYSDLKLEFTTFDINGNNLLHQIASLSDDKINEDILGFVRTLTMVKNLNIDELNGIKQTPLHLAVEKQNEALVKVFLDMGCKTNIKNNSNQDAFQLALAIFNKKIIKLFSVSI